VNSPECRSWRAVVLPGCQAHATLGSGRLLRSSRPSSTTTLWRDRVGWHPSSSHTAAPMLWPLGEPCTRGGRGSWLPPAFDWVVGCSYLGLPDSGGPVRNPIGANMSLRTRLAIEVGGFDVSIGRVGSRPRGCEETELAIRLTASRPKSVVLYVPAAAVDHHVGKERLGFSYFLRRCWHEGLSKATVVRLAGLSAGLERERSHVAVVIPAALFRDLRSCASGDLTAFMRVTATIGGLATATAGYLTGRARFAGHRRTRSAVLSR
jgi:hypothetical protein